MADPSIDKRHVVKEFWKAMDTYAVADAESILKDWDVFFDSFVDLARALKGTGDESLDRDIDHVMECLTIVNAKVVARRGMTEEEAPKSAVIATIYFSQLMLMVSNEARKASLRINFNAIEALHEDTNLSPKDFRKFTST